MPESRVLGVQYSISLHSVRSLLIAVYDSNTRGYVSAEGGEAEMREYMLSAALESWEQTGRPPWRFPHKPPSLRPLETLQPQNRIDNDFYALYAISSSFASLESVHYFDIHLRVKLARCWSPFAIRTSKLSKGYVPAKILHRGTVILQSLSIYAKKFKNFARK